MKILITVCITFIIVYKAHSQTSITPYCPPQANGNDTWDWRNSTYTFYLNGSDYLSTNGVVNMTSPWFGGNSLNLNVNKFYLQNPKDFEPNDGWEMVQREFGSAGNPINHPYFILYNKYSGILRIFVAISNVVGQNNSAVITLTYAKDTKRTAVLELLSPNSYANALIDFDNQVPEIKVGNDYNFSLPYWMHADFVMNYDPCTCATDKNQLYFNVSLVQSSSLSFELGGSAIQNMDNLGRKGTGKQGFSTIVEAGKDVVDGGVSFNSSAKSGLNVLKDIFPTIKYENIVADNILMGLGSAAGIVSKLIGVFTNTTAESQPIAYDINLKSKNGEIKTNNPHRPIILDNPGSQLVPQTLINYKNVMGIFSMLEPPKINVVISNPFTPWGIYGKFYDVTLAEDLKYAINPNAGFDLSKSTVQAAYVYEDLTRPCNVFVAPDAYSNLNYMSDTLLISNFLPLNVIRNFRARAAVPISSDCRPTVFLKIQAILRKTDSQGKVHESVFIAKYPTVINTTTNITSPTNPPYADFFVGSCWRAFATRAFASLN